MNDQPVSMIESSHEAAMAQNAAPVRRRSIVPIIVIGVCLGLLIVLTVVLLMLVKNDGDVHSYRYLPEYKKTYKCATDEYNYHDNVFDVQFGLKEDNTYKFAISNDEYRIGSFREEERTYAKSADGANEINYHLTLKREKTYLNNKDITEAAGDEEHFVVNINEKSDVMVLTNSDEDTVFYCLVK
ncbi:MAG: hypothetical protein K6F57_03095 [Candidatus Saccharibacteria bacterium]|nr:hypothetical protein [Candidatus Saccharibacteria bacterium]